VDNILKSEARAHAAKMAGAAERERELHTVMQQLVETTQALHILRRESVDKTTKQGSRGQRGDKDAD
jgi:regulator of protease activity HflC (stomatin/prohibitin superfamily)